MMIIFGFGENLEFYLFVVYLFTTVRQTEREREG